MSDELGCEILNRMEQYHAEYMQKFAEHGKYLAEHSKCLAEHGKYLAEHSKCLAEHGKYLVEHSKCLDEHGNRLAEQGNRLDQYGEDIQSIKRSLVLIEDAVYNKIPALFDAFMVSQQKDEELSTDVKKLEKTSDFHSLKISILEDTSKKHSEQLARLSS